MVQRISRFHHVMKKKVVWIRHNSELEALAKEYLEINKNNNKYESIYIEVEGESLGATKDEGGFAANYDYHFCNSGDSRPN